ncbi:MAG: ribosomal protein S18-alanine N-acetyltransferase [Clostridiales bacterium]|jgi:ribosomal-protein-alanine N-acetyltransferase|nr:ribosomal protein S18-alanine N-acetyltransferase [Clostridiales bacterium]
MIDIVLLPSEFPAEDPVLDQLAAIEKICFGKDAWSKDMILSSIRQSCTQIWTAKDIQLSKIFAYAILYQAGDEGDIANIAVLPDYRRMGIGGMLLDTMLQHAKTADIRAVYLEVRQSNIPAIQLYLSKGFQEIGKRKKYYKNPTEDALLMVKAIL